MLDCQSTISKSTPCTACTTAGACVAASADGDKDYDDKYEHEKHEKQCRRSKKPWSYECAMYHAWQEPEPCIAVCAWHAVPPETSNQQVINYLIGMLPAYPFQQITSHTCHIVELSGSLCLCSTYGCPTCKSNAGCIETTCSKDYEGKADVSTCMLHPCTLLICGVQHHCMPAPTPRKLAISRRFQCELQVKIDLKCLFGKRIGFVAVSYDNGDEDVCVNNQE